MEVKMTKRIARLPDLLRSKIYKSGQTRGADDDQIYQNRVGRSNTVLIPLGFWDNKTMSYADSGFFETGYIVLISPDEYFSLENPEQELLYRKLKLGFNCLVFFKTRREWNDYSSRITKWTPATSRTSPLGGEYVARIPATTALLDGDKINRGFTDTKQKGAGIRFYEYAQSEIIALCRLQLEAIYWLCHDSVEAAEVYGMTSKSASDRKKKILSDATEKGLFETSKLQGSRIINKDNYTVCPLCLEKISAHGFYTRMSQAEGREVPDITVTEINLFHIKELRNGVFNHTPYNIGWGHHHCNVVVKDAGINATLHWMKTIVDRNNELGFSFDLIP